MMRWLKKNKGQNTLEYAILIVMIVMALIGVQAYLKRGIQGRLRDASDQIGDQFSAEFTSYNYTTNTFANITESQDAFTTNTTYNQQWSQRTGDETIGNFQQEEYRE